MMSIVMALKDQKENGYTMLILIYIKYQKEK